jgi:hypothetical protein
VLARLEDAVGEVYKGMQFAGSEVFKTDLQRDYVFWSKCDGRWGVGPGYRDAIRDYTADQFKSHYDDAHFRIKEMIIRVWERLVGILDGIIRDEGMELETSSVAALEN